MEYRAYLRVLLARWPVILLLCLAGAAGSLAYSARAPRIYRATAQLSVTPSIIEFWTGQAVERQLNNYAWRIRSQMFAEEVAGRVSGLAAGDMAGRIRAVAAPSEFRIAIEVDDTQAERARDIANTAARHFVEKVQAATAGKERQDISVEVGDFASTPAAPFTPRPPLNALAGALLGALLACLLAFLLEYLDDSVKTAGEAQRILALPVLAAIPPSARRAAPRPLAQTLLGMFEVGGVGPLSSPKPLLHNRRSKIHHRSEPS